MMPPLLCLPVQAIRSCSLRARLPRRAGRAAWHGPLRPRLPIRGAAASPVLQPPASTPRPRHHRPRPRDDQPAGGAACSCCCSCCSSVGGNPAGQRRNSRACAAAHCGAVPVRGLHSSRTPQHWYSCAAHRGRHSLSGGGGSGVARSASRAQAASCHGCRRQHALCGGGRAG